MKYEKTYEKSIRARWGEQLATSKRGYTTVPNVLLDTYNALGITEGEFVFLMEIIYYKWTVNKPYPSFKTIANKMGRARNTVQSYARSLEEKGLIKRCFRKGLPNKIDVAPLVKALELLEPYPKLDKEGIKNTIKLCQKTDTKEDKLRRKDNKGFYQIKEVINVT